MASFNVPNFKEDHLSVGVRLPNRQSQKPISGQHLYWIKPGRGQNFVTCLYTGHSLVANHKITVSIVDLRITTGE